MNRHFIQVTNGLLPVAVLALLAVAFIAGQARADLQGDTGIDAELSSAPSASIVISVDMLRKVESLPVLADALMMLPGEYELRIKLPGDPSVGIAAATARH